MSSKNRRIFQLVVVAGVAVILGLFERAAFAHTYSCPFKVMTPELIYLANNTSFGYGQVTQDVAADYDISPDIGMCTGGYHSAYTTMRVSLGNERASMEEIIGRAEPTAMTPWGRKNCFEQYVDVVDGKKKWRTSGYCDTENYRVDYVRIKINNRASSFDAFMAEGGKGLERQILTHEAGHGIGLNHSLCYESPSVMGDYIQCQANSLMSHDRSDIDTLYP